jgi:hypothetical protein
MIATVFSQKAVMTEVMTLFPEVPSRSPWKSAGDGRQAGYPTASTTRNIASNGD